MLSSRRRSARAAPGRIEQFDALDNEIRANPWPYYRWLQQHPQRRIYKLPFEENFYLVHHHDDVVHVLMDPLTFSSQIFHDREIPFFPMMMGDAHRRIRGVVQTLFTPGAIRSLTPAITRVVQRCTGDFLRAGGGDCVALWAGMIPLAVIASIVGHPDDDRSLARLREQAIALNVEAFPVGGTGERDAVQQPVLKRVIDSARLLALAPQALRLLTLIGASGAAELQRYIGSRELPADAPRQYVSRGDTVQRKHQVLRLLVRLAELFRAHVRHPDPDQVISRFVQSHRDGQISMVEMMMACLIILLAGFGTSSSLLGCGVYRLASDPALYSALKSQPERIDGFVEELLRWYTPLQRTARRVTAPVELGGTRLPKDAQLIVLLAAANMDEARFQTPYAFDAGRAYAAQHIAFGKGIHVCLGAPLARLEARLAFSHLLERTRSLHIGPLATPSYIVDRDTGMYGFERLQIVAEPI